MKKKLNPIALAVAAVVGTALVAAPAFAADPTTVDAVDTALFQSGIGALKVAMLALIGTLTAYYSTIFAVNKAMQFMKRKSGAS